jgi:hypothetical protein
MRAEENIKWLTVYTDYGYGVVDADKFQAELVSCAEQHAAAQ